MPINFHVTIALNGLLGGKTMLGNCFIKLMISGTGLDLDGITNVLNTSPDIAYKKGDMIASRFKTDKTEHTEDGWITSVEFDKQPLELGIETFVLQFVPYAKYLKELSKSHDVTFWVSLYPETEQFNVNLTKETITALCKMGATFDFGVAFLQTLYNG